MGMEIKKSFAVRAPAEEVWAFLTDPRKVASCLPGAAITEDLGDDAYAGTMKVKVGPVSANYRGKLKFERLDKQAGEAELSASGQETKGKGAADMRMKSLVVSKGPADTEVEVTSDVNVVGVLAQFGRGMIDDVSDQLFEKFTTAMRSQLEPADAGDAESTDADEADAATDAAPVEAKAPGKAASSAPADPPTGAEDDALDLGSIGAKAAGRAAGRAVTNPLVWFAVVILLVLLYWFFLR